MKKTLLFLAVTMICSVSFATVRLPNVFGDSMVLQRDKPIPVWGWADKNEKITIRFNQQVKTVKADKNGQWKILLNPEKAGGPYDLSVKGSNNITLHDVLMGDVWICSGQSNMEFRVKQVLNADKETAQSANTEIRHFYLPKEMSATPKEDVQKSSWKPASPENTGGFTAVGYFFAKALNEQLHVPIGLIHTSWGGTIVETWISREGLAGNETFRELMKNTPVLTGDRASSLAAAGGGTASVNPNSYPSLLYNAMINPILPFAIKGAIWYQGESNADRAYEYRQSFPLLINDWRRLWKQGDFPFYFVQLASFNATNGTSKNGSSWAELREAQTLSLNVPNTGMAVITDLGESADIHPKNKQDVGKRLAAVALHNTYGQNNVFSGPVYQSMQVNGNKVTLSFTSLGSGLEAKDKYGYVRGFEVAGADHQFHYAKAFIDGDKVVVYTDEVNTPVAIRYGWADDNLEDNLFNKEGFPASPFRTDKWKGVTESRHYKVL